MAVKTYKPTTPSRRNMTTPSFAEITKKTPEKSLLTVLKKNAGRNNTGRITVRHHGGGNKKKYRIIDFKAQTRLSASNTILTVPLTLCSLKMKTVRRATLSLPTE